MVDTYANNAPIAEIDGLIESLLRKRSRWVEQVGLSCSDMKQLDITFIDRQIERLELLKIRVNTTLSSVEKAIEKHTENW
jgi:hypothetical protein